MNGDNPSLPVYAVPSSECPYCGYKVEMASNVDIGQDERDPQPGDVSICMSCASALVFDDNLGLRIPTKHEAVVINEDEDIRRVQNAVRMVDWREVSNGRGL